MKTKFGEVSISNKGYYRITSRKEGNFGKLLHRLVFEDFYQIELPEDIIIHHDDGNKLNNEIWNLIPMTKSEHDSYHHTGERNINYGKPLPKETKQKLSDVIKGQKRSNEAKQKMSKSRNNSGYFRVCKRQKKDYNQGFAWCYDYLEDGKRKTISSKDLDKLKEKVKARGLLWKKFESDVGVI